MRSTFLALAASSLLWVSCNNDSNDDGGSNTVTLKNQTLMFTAIDPSAYPYQASLYKMDLVTKDLAEVLSGESSDAVIYHSNDAALFFNRSSDSQNFRLLAPENDHTFSIREQKKFANGGVGDPHDALNLNVAGDNVLLANYNQGSLVVINQLTGEEVSRVEADWDLPAGIPFAPESLLTATVNGKTFIYVVHQGAAFINSVYATNGSQQVFVLEQNGDKLSVVDQDPNTAKVQGIKLQGSIPVGVRFTSRGKLLFVSMCSQYLAPTPACHSAVEEIDPSDNKVTVLWDLDGSPYFMNGTVIAGPDENTVFVSVAEETSMGVYKNRLLRMDVKKQTAVTAYNYAEGSGGFFAAFFDATSQTLYVGDINPDKDTIGKFEVIPEKGDSSVIKLPLVPYSGVLLTAPAK